MSEGAWFTPARPAGSTSSPAITALHKSFSAVSFTGASTGTITAANSLSGAVLAAWKSITHAEVPCENRIKELQDFIAKQKTDITEFDETLVNKLIEKIAVFFGHFTVEFKSGLTIDIEA
ncbi:hypothetical protein [Streptococcus oralis]|uniref:hypothetical protein n=1 Tax=Streptococcus oralis TaxID=1303 RepID=UPI001E318B96|nr:hypothetical protein [Streptococcus oralis]